MNSAEQFEAIVTEHYEPLFRFAMSLTRSEAEAEELTQQTFLVWATKGHQVRDFTKVKTWLFTTLHRAFLAARQRQTRFPHCGLDEVAHELPAPAPGLAAPADCALVLPALARVDAVYRAAVALFYLDDCSYNDIAAILAVPLGTVKSRIARGIGQLREILFAEVPGARSPSRKGFSSRTSAAETAALRKNTRPPPRPVAPPPVQTTELGFGEWDESATRFSEHPAVA